MLYITFAKIEFRKSIKNLKYHELFNIKFYLINE